MNVFGIDQKSNHLSQQRGLNKSIPIRAFETLLKRNGIEVLFVLFIIFFQSMSSSYSSFFPTRFSTAKVKNTHSAHSKFVLGICEEFDRYNSHSVDIIEGT